MARYIDADKLKKDVLNLQDCYNGFSDTYDKVCIIGVIDEQPSAQPERKKGEWMFDGFTKCSECGYRPRISSGWNYCPNCGADMRGEKDD